MYGWLDLKPLFLGRFRPELLTSNQMASQKLAGSVGKEFNKSLCSMFLISCDVKVVFSNYFLGSRLGFSILL